MVSTIVDTGPLVAALRDSEAAHPWAVAQFRALPAPLLTCEPVLAETFFLLSRHSNGARQFFGMLHSGLLRVRFSLADEEQALSQLVAKYKDLPMSLADACLVRMAELHPGASVLTLDGHFRVYRKHGRQLIPVIMPEAP